MSYEGHHIFRCSCGTIISQCRCMAPNKYTKVIQDGCKACQQKVLDSIRCENEAKLASSGLL